MPTPYEEISNNRSGVEVIKADANLSNDSNKLGGIDAEEYATKEYVNRKDEANSTRDQKYTDDKIKQLQEDLKGYTDTAIGNQDFTDFAKKQDLEAMQEQLGNNCEESCQNTLEQAITHCETHCTNTLNSSKEYTDEKANELNGKYDELFQSVSDGKRKIAEAVTDKGVETSATDTYDKMASNIRGIQTGGGGIDTSDATATPDTILNGYTAYAKGSKITGRYDPMKNPIYGDDTSDATAYSGDIRQGKTAYARGQKLIGTLVVREVTEHGTGSGEVEHVTDLEEINRLEQNLYENKLIDQLTPASVKEDYIGEDGSKQYTIQKDYTISGYWLVALGNQKQGSLIRIATETITIQSVSGNKETKTLKYIYSNPISSDGSRIVDQKTDISTDNTEDLKKWRYTYDELDIGDEETIIQVLTNCTNSVLGIVTKGKRNYSDKDCWIRFYEFDNNRYIKKLKSNNEGFMLGILKKKVVASKLSPYMFAYRTETSSVYLLKLKVYSALEEYTISGTNIGLMHGSSELRFEVSDTLLSDGQGTYAFLGIDEDPSNQYYNCLSLGTILMNTYSGHMFLSDDGQYALNVDSTQGHDILYKTNINYNTYNIQFTEIAKNKLFDFREAHDVEIEYNNWGLDNIEARFTKDNSKIIFWGGTAYTYGGAQDRQYCLAYDINSDTGDVYRMEVLRFAWLCTTGEMFISDDCSSIYTVAGSDIYLSYLSTTNIIVAVKYKGQMFYSPQGLSIQSSNKEA